MSGCNPECWMLDELGRKEGRERSRTVEFTWERGTGKIVWEMLQQKPFFFFFKSLLFHCCLLEQKQPMQRQRLKTKRPDTYFLILVSNISCDICNSYTINRNARTQSSFPGFSENDILFLLASFPHLSMLSAGGRLSPPLLWLFSFPAATASHSVTFALPFDRSQNATFRKLTYQRKWKHEAGQPNMLLSYPVCH